MTGHGLADRFPGAGDLGVLSRLAARFQQQRADLEETATTIRGVRAALGAHVWTGEAGEAWRTEAEEPAQALTTATASLESAETAVRRYVDRVELIAERARRQRGHLEDAEATLRRNGVLVGWSAFLDDAPMLSFASPTTPQIEEAELMLRLATSELQTLHHERQEADDALCAALSADQPPGWAATSAALRRAGLRDTEDLTAARVASAVTALAADASRGAFGEQELADLLALLSSYDADPDVMSQVFLSLGGDGTTRLIDVIGRFVYAGGDAAPALALAEAVRRGFAQGSARWTAGTAERFARELLPGPSIVRDGRAAALGFLLGDADQAPAGEQLALALADRIDELERSEAVPGIDGPWSLTMGPTFSELLVTGGPDEAGRVRDVAGRILQTLGEYPDAALGWLRAGGGGTIGDARIDYWFGERDWSVTSTGDGFEGPAALWGGATRATGGPVDGWSDRSSTQAVATVTSLVVAALARNGHLRADQLSVAGSVELATVLGLHLPQLTEYPLLKAFDPSLKEPVAWGEVLESGALRDLPVVRDTDVKWLVALATAEPEGGVVLRAQSEVYQAVVIATALESGPEGALSAEGAIRRVLQLESVVAGGQVGTEHVLAALRDQGVRDALKVGSGLVGAVGVAGGYAGSLTYGTAVTIATDGLERQLAHHYTDALAAEATLDRPAREAALRKDVEHYVATFQDGGRWPPEVDPQSFVDELVSAYQDTFDSAYLHAGRGPA